MDRHQSKQPNIIFIMSDDHAAHAISAYQKGPVCRFGERGRPAINRTPHLDRIADEGVRLDNCFCTNSICTPSRASILTGTYNHVNGCTTLATPLDSRLNSFPKMLQAGGYQTAIFGKWHLGDRPECAPSGFDEWGVLFDQGEYFDPRFRFNGKDGEQIRTIPGYATDVITDVSLAWLERRDPDRPFCLLTHHKAPHRFWNYDEAHAKLFEDEEIPEPETLFDTYANRARAAAAAHMRVGEHMVEADLDALPPPGLKGDALRRWGYQIYMKKYLRCVASIDDNVGRMLDWLDANGLAEDTIVVYTSDQGFFLGDHGWFDKRFMYEESLRMPMLVRYPRGIPAGRASDALALNVDFAQTFLDYAGIEAPADWQGCSLRPVLEGETPDDWRDAIYYRYWMCDSHHNTTPHYGIRTARYKLIYYYNDGLETPGSGDQICEREWGFRREGSALSGPLPPEWELFDLQEDPFEMRNVVNHPDYASIVDNLKTKLHRLQAELGDERYAGDVA